MNKSQRSKTPTVPYESNPFVSTFKGFSNLFTYNQTPTIVILIFSVLTWPFQFNFGGGSDSGSSNTATSSGDVSPALVIGIIGGLIAVTAIVMTLSVLLNGVVKYVAYKTSKQETTTIGQALSVSLDRFWTILYVMVVSGLKVFGGMLLFIIPGIRASLRYQMALFPVFDEGLNGREAMKRIKFLTKDHLIEIFGLTTVASLIFPITTLLSMGGHSIMYQQLKALKDSKAEKPPVHWLNYIGFIIAGFFMLVLMLVLVVVLAVANA